MQTKNQIIGIIEERDSKADRRDRLIAQCKDGNDITVLFSKESKKIEKYYSSGREYYDSIERSINGELSIKVKENQDGSGNGNTKEVKLNTTALQKALEQDKELFKRLMTQYQAQLNCMLRKTELSLDETISKLKNAVK